MIKKQKNIPKNGELKYWENKNDRLILKIGEKIWL